MPRLTARERREGYLREYGYQQRTGKPFFPFALVHDVIANCFFVFLIVGLACLWYFTAKHGVDINHGGKSGVLGPLYENRADPAVESYDPRPEWYFFFLFELLRLFQNPELLLFATIIIPTLFMVVLIGMPFIDRSRERRLSRRPISVGFAGAMAVLLLGLTWYGSKAPGAAVAGTTKLAFTANLPCASCHVAQGCERLERRRRPEPRLEEADVHARGRPHHERQGRHALVQGHVLGRQDQVHRDLRRDRVARRQRRREARRVALVAHGGVRGHHVAPVRTCALHVGARFAGPLVVVRGYCRRALLRRHHGRLRRAVRGTPARRPARGRRRDRRLRLGVGRRGHRLRGLPRPLDRAGGRRAPPGRRARRPGRDAVRRARLVRALRLGLGEVRRLRDLPVLDGDDRDDRLVRASRT